jgi:hypothetical protein
MGIYAVKPRFRRPLRGSARSLAARGVTPDQVTSAGIVASGLGALALGAGGRWRGAFVAVPVLAFARTAANALDGLVAEESGLGRPAGELYNETADGWATSPSWLGRRPCPGSGRPWPWERWPRPWPRPARVLNASLALIAAGVLVTAANRYRHAHGELDAARA